MKIPPTIEVTEDGTGNITYRLRTTLLNTQSFGEIFATLIGNVATMMHVENPKISYVDARAQIIHYLLNELEKPTVQSDMSMLQ